MTYNPPSRSYSWNAYESTLDGGAGATGDVTVLSAAGLTEPVYLCIDPESPTKREYIKVTAIATNTLTCDRGLPGSANGAQAHATDTLIRAVPVHQWLDDIFNDIAAVGQSVLDHEGGVDPHPVYLTQVEGDALYLALAGGTMTGAINMGSNKITNLALPTVDEDAASKGYVDFYVDTTHAGDVDAHHAKYTDAEAVTAMGVEGDANPLNHARYADAEAVAAFLASPEYASIISRLDALEAGAPPAAHTHAAADTISGQFATGRIPNLDAAKITSGIFATARIPNLAASKITSGVFAEARIPDIAASKIKVGAFKTGTYTFTQLTVTGAMGVGGSFELPNLPAGAGTNDVRWNSTTGALSRN